MQFESGKLYKPIIFYSYSESEPLGMIASTIYP